MAYLQSHRFIRLSCFFTASRTLIISRSPARSAKRALSSDDPGNVFGVKGPAWVRRRRDKGSTLDEAAAGLVWLDKSLSMRRGMQRISTEAIKAVMAAGGHRGGFTAMHQLQHKTRAGNAFYSDVVELMDDAEKKRGQTGETTKAR